MSRSSRRLLLLLIALPVFLTVMALAYQSGMRYLEGDPRSFLRSLAWAAETLTTTGYGSDSAWSHPLMVTLVIIAQLVGVLLIFLMFPIFLLPYLEERFETRLPREVDEVEGHTVILGYGPAVAGFVGELGRIGREVVIIERDREAARDLVDRGLRVIFRRLDDEALEAACLDTAHSLSEPPRVIRRLF